MDALGDGFVKCFFYLDGPSGIPGHLNEDDLWGAGNSKITCAWIDQLVGCMAIDDLKPVVLRDAPPVWRACSILSWYPPSPRLGAARIPLKVSRVKKCADVYLASSDLDWVIVRPGTLVDRPGTGAVRAGLAIAYAEIPRDDVAAFFVAVVGQKGGSRRIIELTEGDMPVDKAVLDLGN